MRIGLMGGTFDPPHLGHTIPVASAFQEFSLDSVWFIPAFIPPHKQEDAITNSFHRAAMVAIALQDYPQFLFSPLELTQAKICYSVDTVITIRKNISSGDSLFFMMGSDSFVELETWHDYGGLLQLCQLIIINRDHNKEELKDTLDRLQDVLHQDLSHRVLFSNAPYLPISSTNVRNALQNGQSVSSWLDARVEAYISKHLLYPRR